MSGGPAGQGPGGFDPRPPPAGPAAGLEALRPAVSGRPPVPALALSLAAATVVGAATFLVLSQNRSRTSGEVNLAAVRPEPGAALEPLPPPPRALLDVEAAARAPTYAAPAQAILVPSSAPAGTAATAVPPPPIQTGVDPSSLAKHAPSLVVDLGEAPPAPATRRPEAKPVGAAGPTGAPGALSGEEQFAQRVGAAEPERSRAGTIGDQRTVIAQGSVIPAVLETALDSDLPGFARAVVSRDVRGFDGSLTLIPRGSRVVGQYKSAVSQGASRIFVIWTRVIRPDGGSIQIGSPVTDPLGRAGLEGRVDRHFFERFGGAILLSVLNAGVTSLSRAPSTQVVIGSSAEATNLGAQAIQPTTISPTIKVAQGAAIRIFVARDLEFSMTRP